MPEPLPGEGPCKGAPTGGRLSGKRAIKTYKLPTPTPSLKFKGLSEASGPLYQSPSPPAFTPSSPTRPHSFHFCLLFPVLCLCCSLCVEHSSFHFPGHGTGHGIIHCMWASPPPGCESLRGWTRCGCTEGLAWSRLMLGFQAHPAWCPWTSYFSLQSGSHRTVCGPLQSQWEQLVQMQIPTPRPSQDSLSFAAHAPGLWLGALLSAWQPPTGLVSIICGPWPWSQGFRPP